MDGLGFDTGQFGPGIGETAFSALIPEPRSIDYGVGWLPVKGGFQVEWQGYRNAVLDLAATRFQDVVARRTGLDVGRPGAVQLRIDCRGEDKNYLTRDAREHHALMVKDDGVMLTADGPAGVLRGLATLRQAITNVPGGFAIPAVGSAEHLAVLRAGLEFLSKPFVHPAALARGVRARERLDEPEQEHGVHDPTGDRTRLLRCISLAPRGKISALRQNLQLSEVEGTD